MAEVLKERGYEVALGDVWSDDTGINDARFHARMATTAACDGSVIVLHVPAWPSRFQTLDILEAIIPALKQRGLGFESLTQLFAGESADESLCGVCGVCVACIVAAPCIAFLSCAVCSMRCMRILLQLTGAKSIPLREPGSICQSAGC